MSKAITEILQQTQQRLQDLEFCPDVEPYREGISRECNVAVGLLKELHQAEARKSELEATLLSLKDQPNKLPYSNAVKERSRVEKQARESSAAVNHAVRNHETFLANKKRAAIETERIDDIIRVAQLELAEYDDTLSLRDATDGYVPLHLAREQALAKMTATTTALEEVRDTLQREKEEHRALVYELKIEIKATKTDIEAMENGTYAPAVEFETKLSERREAQTSELESQRRALTNGIEQLQTKIANDTLVHNANVAAFEAERTELEQKLAALASSNATAMQETESALETLKEEQAANFAVLQKLEERLAEEAEGARVLQAQEEKRLKEIEERRLAEEKEYFAALWIQLRWKAFLKRKALKGSKKKGKKGKKGKKK
ncbi:hypothetical protein ACHAXT_011500 [Thalassiosira profunda]